MNAKVSCVLGAASLLLIWAADAAAQTAATVGAYRLHCQVVPGAHDVIDASSRRALVGASLSCRVEGGPMDGGLMAGTTLGEVRGDAYVGFSGSSVTRKPGSLLVSVHNEFGQRTVRDSDGKVKDMQGSGRGRYVLAIGDAAPLSGRNYRYVVRGEGTGVVVVEVVPE